MVEGGVEVRGRLVVVSTGWWWGAQRSWRGAVARSRGNRPGYLTDAASAGPVGVKGRP